MTNEQALSMDEAKLKLVELEKHIPYAVNDIVYKFGRLLTGRLNPELVPLGFVVACELLLSDLQAGVDGFTNEPIRSSLVGYPPMTYKLLAMDIPTIAEAIFPEEFAEGVKTSIDDVRKRLKKEATS